MEKKILHQPYSYRHPEQGTGMSLSDRFTLINMQKRISGPPFNQRKTYKSYKGKKNFKTGRTYSVANEFQVTKISGGQSVFSRIGAAPTFPAYQRVNNNANKNRKSKSKFHNSKLAVIREEGGKEIDTPNLQSDFSARKIAKLSSKKRKIVDANDLDRDLEEYMAAAPHVSSPEIKDELPDLIDFDEDIMDMDE